MEGTAGRARRVVRRTLDRARADGARTVVEGPAAGLRIGGAHASADYATGRNEVPLQEAFVRRAHPGAVVFDVGANVGFFSLLAARLVGDDGHVVAFEAVPGIAEEVVANVARNGFGNVDVRAVAVGARAGRAELRRTEHPGGATIDPLADALDVVAVQEVEVVALDDLVGGGALPVPHLVKVDVEGHEEAVLDGMGATIERHHPALLIELDAAEAEALAARTAVVAERLRRWGYRVEQLPRAYEGTTWSVTHLEAVVA